MAGRRRLDAQTVRELIDELRRLGGAELLVKRASDNASARPMATRLRRVLGPNFYVTAAGNEIRVRARRSGEPEIQGKRLRMGKEWMTIRQAAVKLGMTEQWLRSQYLKTGKIAKYHFGSRIALRTEDVAAVYRELHPGGAVVGRKGEHPRNPAVRGGEQ